jgi:exopolysaccharide biosynthesis protein
LVLNGQAQPARVNKSTSRHPRSAVGWNDKEIMFVTVDGRQPRLSNGMTLPELADFLVKLQCTEAMNLDGGGSAEVWMDGKILNSPCYGHERSTANALVLVEKEAQ